MGNTIFRDLLNKGMVVFIDNILIYSYRSIEKHIKLILQLLEKYKQQELEIKLTKYVFYKKELKFLGYIISG